MKQPRIYVAGPMTGYENYNFDAFDKAAEQLRAKGWMVINPADLDRLHWGFKGYCPDDIIPRLFSDRKALIRSCIARDINALMEFGENDAIYLLNGWEDSVGANAELAVFNWIGLTANMRIYREADGIPEA